MGRVDVIAGASLRKPRSFPIVRNARDGWLTGAAAGLADRILVDPLIVRAAFAVLSLAGGAGIVLYMVLAGLSADPDGATRTVVVRRAGWRQVLAVSLVVCGMLLLLREAGIWFGDRVVWPLALAAAGTMLIWATSEAGAAGDREGRRGTRRTVSLRSDAPRPCASWRGRLS